MRSSRAVARGPELVAIEEETYGAEDAPEVATEAEIEATREAMRGLAQHLAAYRIERQSYPARLADLVAPTDARPRGFLDGGELPTDAWGRAFSYELGESGYKLWSRGADGLDQRGGGDDIVGG